MVRDLPFQGWLLESHPFLRSLDADPGRRPLRPVPPRGARAGPRRRHRPTCGSRSCNATTRRPQRTARAAATSSCAPARAARLLAGPARRPRPRQPAHLRRRPLLESLITVVPFGVPEAPPVKTAPRHLGRACRASASTTRCCCGAAASTTGSTRSRSSAPSTGSAAARPDVRLLFMGLKPPEPRRSPTMRMAVRGRELADELALTAIARPLQRGLGAVRPTARRTSSRPTSASRRTSTTSRPRSVPHPRTRLHLGRAADRLDRRRRDGRVIETRNLGLTVAAEDVEGLSDALHRLLDDEELATEARKNAAELAPELTWSRVLQPLLAFCRAPERAPDQLDPEARRKLDRTARLVANEGPGLRRDLRSVARYVRQGRTRDSRPAWPREAGPRCDGRSAGDPGVDRRAEPRRG